MPKIYFKHYYAQDFDSIKENYEVVVDYANKKDINYNKSALSPLGV